MRAIIFLAVLGAFSAAAMAQGNMITVVNPDGTKSTVDLGPQMELPTAKSAPTPAKKPAAVKPAPATKKAAAKPAKKPVAAKKPASKKTAKKVSQNKTTPKKQSAVTKPLTKPPTKPVIKPGQKVAPDTDATRPQRLGPAMTPDDAIRIALDAAPPARSVHAIPVNYKGLHAYQVIFRTEEGDRSLFVDRETARLVK